MLEIDKETNEVIRYIPYINDLIEAFGFFKTNPVNDLILCSIVSYRTKLKQGGINEIKRTDKNV